MKIETCQDTKKIQVEQLIKGAYTYPSWSSDRSYSLQSQKNGKNLKVYYKTSQGRIIKRKFPQHIILSPKFCYTLGFLKGEGPTALGKSNYRRLTITNSGPKILKFVLEELERADLYNIEKLPQKSITLIHHQKNDNEVISFWSKELNLSCNYFRCFEDKSKTSPYGVCHVYISDVLLRRIIDLLHANFLEDMNFNL